MSTKLDGTILAEAFPTSLREDAILAARMVGQNLHDHQRTGRFSIKVEQEIVLIPSRLWFAFKDSDGRKTNHTALMAQSLRTRSNDGFQRQKAALSLLADPQPWSAPFLLALIGEYVVEILTDIDYAMHPALLTALGDCISANPCYWQVVKQRITSYWNEYYRHQSRSQYVGFRLVEQLEAELKRRAG